ncbi:type II secretion system secretin GspD [Methylorubrum thiocyanatum]|uniref:type II secretion system secretin GspD n=1 Tax=Methylorubrum thiocyanatum TaxID=47958 RepID=UPI003F7E5921|nr:type II secretion system secretin GspD [Methylobacterium sp. J-043]
MALLALGMMLTACTTGLQTASSDDEIGLLGAAGSGITAPQGTAVSTGMLFDRGVRRPRGYTELGRMDPGPEQRGQRPEVSSDADGKSFSLNFVDTGIQDFVRIVFDEILHESAIVDPGLEGRITVRTTQNVSRTNALDLVRNVLQMNGATLAKTGSVYRIERSGNAAGQKGRSDDSVRAFQLRHIDGEQAKSAVQALSGGKINIFSSKNSRFIYVSGADGDLEAAREILSTLDVDQMSGMSFGLVPLQEAGAKSVATELTNMFGASGNLKAMAIQRINAVLLIGQPPDLLGRAKAWAHKLDQGGQDQRKVFVYAIQNRRAQDLAKVLNGMMGSNASSDPSRAQAAVAPLVRPASASSGGAFNDRFMNAPPEGSGVGSDSGSATPGAEPASMAGERPNPFARGHIGISADISTNSLVVVAKPDEYRLVEAAIRRLDVQPAQVLIEATIFEVRLNDTLRHGVRWFFESGNHGGILTDNASGSTGAVHPGFNYIFQIPRARVVLNALEGMTKLEVISSPALTVLDNQTATLKVGDQVPIATRSAQSVTNPDAPLVNDIQLKDTGIILSVTPRVNVGGLVQLDITQEVSDVVPTTSSAINSPTIRQRSVNSSVAVQSGTEIVLGGLISKRNESSHSGIPVLKDIPLVGEAFSSNVLNAKDRTELLIIIRPVVMSNQSDVFAVTQEIKTKMRNGIDRPTRSVVSRNY